MKILLALSLAIISLASSALAKEKYDHTGTVVYTQHTYDVKMRYMLEGRTDVYYIDAHGTTLSGREDTDNWECVPGDEHHAPDCRTTEGWTTKQVNSTPSMALFVLEDGKRLVATTELCAGNFNPFCLAFSAMETAEKNVNSTFHYRLKELRNGVQGIELEGFKPIGEDPMDRGFRVMPVLSVR